MSHELQQTNQSDEKVLYFGHWDQTTDLAGQAYRRSNTPFNACVLAFIGPTVRWLGSKGPDHGLADVHVDGVLDETIDTYAPTALAAQAIFEKTGLDTGRIHTVRIVVRRQQNPFSTDCFQGIGGFITCEPVDYPESVSHRAGPGSRPA
jgi:hypothetical protein